LTVTINILTIFPEAVSCYLETGMAGRAAKKGLVEYNIVDIRDFSGDKHRKVDDIPYGGGPGMVMQVEPVVKALESLKNPGLKILLCPSGEKYDQGTAEELAGKNITLICGRYTGIDYRIVKFVDRIISVGDYILSGGELPALTITESVIRLIPGVLGDEKSLEEDKGYPVYTRPREFRGLKVPEVLISGDHKKIEEFRNQEANHAKDDKRPDKE